MKRMYAAVLSATYSLLSATGFGLEVSAQEPVEMAAAERMAIFRAAGAVQRGDKWIVCADDPQAEGAAIDQISDLNGDGRPEAFVSEGGSFCYGFTGMGFQLLSQQADGSWKRITGDIGMPEPLETMGKDGWPDLSIGGPGFCFPVQRWNGKEYALHRFEYQGKACKPER
jgi:hypothetical protein